MEETKRGKFIANEHCVTPVCRGWFLKRYGWSGTLIRDVRGKLNLPGERGRGGMLVNADQRDSTDLPGVGLGDFYN